MGARVAAWKPGAREPITVNQVRRNGVGFPYKAPGRFTGGWLATRTGYGTCARRAGLIAATGVLFADSAAPARVGPAGDAPAAGGPRPDTSAPGNRLRNRLFRRDSVLEIVCARSLCTMHASVLQGTLRRRMRMTLHMPRSDPHDPGLCGGLRLGRVTSSLQHLAPRLPIPKP
jgi:hypothetical protein